MSVLFSHKTMKIFLKSLLVFILSRSFAQAVSSNGSLNETELDCQVRALTFRYSQFLQPWRSDLDPLWQTVYDALELDRLCHISFPEIKLQPKFAKAETQQQRKRETPCATAHCIFVDPIAKNDNLASLDGSMTRPYATLAHALRAARVIDRMHQTTIVLRQGVHALEDTIYLGQKDSGLRIQGYPKENVWISGAVTLPSDLSWQPWHHDPHVYWANLTTLLQGRSLPHLPSLFTSDARYVRARYPNGNPETAQWGYSSPDRYKYSLKADDVLEWHRPPPGEIPTFTVVNFKTDPPPGTAMKNDSTHFNVYSTGEGGACSAVWGNAPNYWCSNASNGGWAELERECAVTGQIQIPNGLTYNETSTIGQKLNSYLRNNSEPSLAVGGIIHAWHSQSWAMHMFEIEQHDANASLYFTPGSGSQGARNWCRCDQCGYAAHWCGQYQDPPWNDTRLISGTWMLENVLPELDFPGEYYWDPVQQLLYVYPNSTDTWDDLHFAVLENLVVVDGAISITLQDIGFRHSAATYMSREWSPPSGGDWSMHRGGAVWIRNSENITIDSCLFTRLDGTGIFLSNYTRYISIQHSEFAWMGETAIATLGQTDGYNATRQQFPLATRIEGNVMRELGIYQKQSSAVGHTLAANSVIQNNIIFNTARAGINFNEFMGGGDAVLRNVLWNTCRESGDHGPINSWDRQQYWYGSESWQQQRRKIAFNLIVANYGASEGVDNDDGSSWYHVAHNVFHQAEGFKMDYGGHDSIFEKNTVIAYPHKRPRGSGPKCVAFDSFLPGHGHIVRDNICIVPNQGPEQALVQLAECSNFHGILQRNTYYTPSGQAYLKCNWDSNEAAISLDEASLRFGIEAESTVHKTPLIEEIVALIIATLFPSHPNDADNIDMIFHSGATAME
jgi:hypothetical protein